MDTGGVRICSRGKKVCDKTANNVLHIGVLNAITMTKVADLACYFSMAAHGHVKENLSVFSQFLYKLQV